MSSTRRQKREKGKGQAIPQVYLPIALAQQEILLPTAGQIRVDTIYSQVTTTNRTNSTNFILTQIYLNGAGANDRAQSCTAESPPLLNRKYKMKYTNMHKITAGQYHYLTGSGNLCSVISQMWPSLRRMIQS